MIQCFNLTFKIEKNDEDSQISALFVKVFLWENVKAMESIEIIATLYLELGLYNKLLKRRLSIKVKVCSAIFSLPEQSLKQALLAYLHFFFPKQGCNMLLCDQNHQLSIKKTCLTVSAGRKVWRIFLCLFCVIVLLKLNQTLPQQLLLTFNNIM